MPPRQGVLGGGSRAHRGDQVACDGAVMSAAFSGKGVRKTIVGYLREKATLGKETVRGGSPS